MLSHADNMQMCQAGLGTPMGEAMRRFWIPAITSDLLAEPDADPVKIELLGEKLVAFRNSEGAVGVLSEKCCHRSASLALGRVEDCGIRCLFHGWKFGVDGSVMETPNVGNPRFRERFKARAYPVREAGGFIWTYLGPKESEPPFPHWRYFDADPNKRLTRTAIVPGNYVGYQEALLDSSHLTLLHCDAFKRNTEVEIDFQSNVVNVAERADPEIEVEDTTFGFHYAATRPVQTPQGLRPEARVTSFFAPFHVLNANGDFIMMVVPMNDGRTIHHFVWWSDDKELAHDPQRRATLEFTGLTDQIMHDFGCHPLSWFEPGKPARENNFRQDRDAMRAGAYSGLPIFFPEDVAMLSSTDDIRDRSEEHLGPCDAPIAKLYRVLLNLSRMAERNEVPSALSVDPMSVSGAHGIVPDGGTWRDLVPEHKKTDRKVMAPAVARASRG